MSLCAPQHGKGPHLERPLPVLEFEHHVELSIETYGGRRPRRATCNANESRGRLEVNLATRPSHAPMRYKSARKSTKPRHSPHASAPARAPSPLAEEMPSALAEDTTPSLPRVREPPESKAVEAANRSRCRSQFTLPSDDRASPTAAAPLVTMGVRRAHRLTNSRLALALSDARTTDRKPWRRWSSSACVTYSSTEPHRRAVR